MWNIDSTEKLLIDLKVISKIGPGTKVNTKEKYLELDDTTWWQGALRWYRGDSRQTSSDKIHNTVASCATIINSAINDYKEKLQSPLPLYLDSLPEEFLILMHNNLKAARVGLENLKDTYIHDTTLSSKLEMDIASLSRQILSIEKNIKTEE